MFARPLSESAENGSVNEVQSEKIPDPPVTYEDYLRLEKLVS